MYHSVVAVGNAQLDTAQKKFGASSLLVDGTGDYIELPDSLDWLLGGGSGAFTVDFWVRFSAFSPNECSFFSHEGPGLTGYDLVHVDNTNVLYFKQFNGSGYDIDVTQTWTPSTGTWYHIALIRGWGGNVNDYALCVDGSILGSPVTDNTQIANYTGKLFIGGNGFDVNGFMNGWIDEFRVSNIARWTTNFTPPSSAYTKDVNTKLLLHFDGADGSTVIKDSSANPPGLMGYFE